MLNPPNPVLTSRPGPADSDEALLASGRRVLEIEALALAAVTKNPPAGFVRACRLCLACRGRIIVTGMGKSGHIARKIASTLSSTGTPSFFVHPAEASHGDLGMLVEGDLVLAISHSGETEEILSLLPRIRRLALPLLTITGNLKSRLAQMSDLVLVSPVSQEACSLNLAPTASTTVALALGDALAVTLLEARGFTREDFAHAHPAGRLGRRLWMRVADLMHQGSAIPEVRPETGLGQALVEMTGKGLGMTAVTGSNRELLGVFTDGDLRRALDRRIDLHDCRMDSVMTHEPKTIGPDALAVQALELMEEHRIGALLVTDNQGRLVGALSMHDLLRAGVV
jgi:arabinose-5-phosphate isomerase